MNRQILVLAAIFLFVEWTTGQTRLDGIEVVSKSMPWTGGWNAPQFSNIDLNRDGIPDLISFDRQGNVLNTFLRAPASGNWLIAREYEQYFPALVDWVLVADYDGDGIEDLFTSASPTGVPGISVFKGGYANDQWNFSLIKDRGAQYLQVPAGQGLANLYVSWEDIPAIVDVDGDGDLDILAFEPNGSFITYFANQSVENGWGRDSLRFMVKDICWGKILESDFSETVFLSDNPNTCSNGGFTGEPPVVIRHAGSTILAIDLDFDGDKDALIGDITSRRIVMLHNGRDAQQAWITDQDAHFPSENISVDMPYFLAAFQVELDDDPEPELLVSINSRTWAEDRVSVWRYDDDPITDGPLLFQLTEKGFLQNEMIDLGSYSHPAVADINGDELPDLIVGAHHYTEEGSLRMPGLWYFENRGTATQPRFELIDNNYLGLRALASDNIYDLSPAFGDIDGNGTIDLIIGANTGRLLFYKNKALPGQPVDYEPMIYPYMDINVGATSAPQLADINGDGLCDLIIGERTGNNDVSGRCSVFNYYENLGSVGNAVFQPDPAVAPNTQCYGRILFDIIPGLPQFASPTIVPGENGLIMLSGNDAGKLVLFTDLAGGKTGQVTKLDGAYGQIDVGTRSRPCLADINADGYYELIVGNQRGGLDLWATDLAVGTVSTTGPTTEIEKPYHLFADPGGQLIDIQISDGYQGNIAIWDLSGREMARISSNGRGFHRIEIGHIPPGLYLVQLQLNGQNWVEKIVKAGR